MRPLPRFEELNVERRRADKRRAAALRAEAKQRQRFLNELVEKLGLTDEKANYVVETAYDILLELVRARMLEAGWHTTGIGAHEAEVAYLRELGFSESEARFANELRYHRNGIVYYGKRFDTAYAKQVLAFLEKARRRL